jgi:hypothetical protein
MSTVSILREQCAHAGRSPAAGQSRRWLQFEITSSLNEMGFWWVMQKWYELWNVNSKGFWSWSVSRYITWLRGLREHHTRVQYVSLYREDGGGTSLRNIGEDISVYTASQFRKQQFSCVSGFEPRPSQIWSSNTTLQSDASTFPSPTPSIFVSSDTLKLVKSELNAKFKATRSSAICIFRPVLLGFRYRRQLDWRGM